MVLPLSTRAKPRDATAQYQNWHARKFCEYEGCIKCFNLWIPKTVAGEENIKEKNERAE